MTCQTCQLFSDQVSSLISSLMSNEFKQKLYHLFNFILCFLHAGHSCKLLTKNMGMLVINEDTLDVSIHFFFFPTSYQTSFHTFMKMH